MKKFSLLAAALMAVCLFASESQAGFRCRAVRHSGCQTQCASAPVQSCGAPASCNSCGFHPVQTLVNGVNRVIHGGCNSGSCTAAPTVVTPNVTGSPAPAAPNFGPAPVPKKGS